MRRGDGGGEGDEEAGEDKQLDVQSRYSGSILDDRPPHPPLPPHLPHPFKSPSRQESQHLLAQLQFHSGYRSLDFLDWLLRRDLY